MSELERQRREQERQEMAVLRQLAAPYRRALDDLALRRVALLDLVQAAPDGVMTGRDLSVTPAFNAFSADVARLLTGFAETADAISQEGVRAVALEARDDAVALILQTVHPDDRDRARSMLAIPTDDELAALVGL